MYPHVIEIIVGFVYFCTIHHSYSNTYNIHIFSIFSLCFTLNHCLVERHQIFPWPFQMGSPFHLDQTIYLIGSNARFAGRNVMSIKNKNMIITSSKSQWVQFIYIITCLKNHGCNVPN